MNLQGRLHLTSSLDFDDINIKLHITFFLENSLRAILILRKIRQKRRHQRKNKDEITEMPFASFFQSIDLLIKYN